MTETEMAIIKRVVTRCVELCEELGNDVENGNGLEDFFKMKGNHDGPIAWACAEFIQKEFGLLDEPYYLPKMYR